MSIFTSLSTKLFAGTLAIAGGMGGIGALASSNPTIQQDVKNVQTAIESKDLNAYKTAKTQLVTDEAKVKTDKINSTTQDELNTMADNQAKRKAVADAVRNNNYEAFKANANPQILNKVNSQAEFDKLVAKYKTQQENLAKLTDAIKNNDFNSFKALAEARQANNPNKDDKRPEPTDAQLQAKFDEMVAKYKADRSLPGQDGDMMGMVGFEGGKGGMKKGGRGMK